MESVLRGMPDQTATAGQICRAVAENPALSVKLLPTDWLPLSNRKHHPGWLVHGSIPPTVSATISHHPYSRQSVGTVVATMCRLGATIRYALERHPRIQQTGAKACKEVLWQLVDEQEGAAIKQQQQRSKRPTATSTHLLGKNIS